MNNVNRPTAKLAFFLIGLFATFSISAGDKNREEKEEEFYASNQLEGFIGVSSNNPLDAPSDNIFEVDLPRTIEEGEQVFLSYELYGVADHTGISRSINDQLAVGGFVAIESNEWRSQREQIKSDWLKKGKNIIRFAIPQGADYHYQVRNLGISVVKEASSERAIIINKPESYKTTDRIGYLKGYVNGANSDEARVQIEGVEVASIGSEFEGLLPKVDEGENWCVSVKVIFPDGEVLREDVQMKAEDQKGFINNLSFRTAEYASEIALPEQYFNLSFQGAELALDAQALVNPKQISIKKLREIDIPALDMALVNVTKSAGGFRFLPHGTQFGSEGKIRLEFDPREIPEGYSKEDIRTYYFNERTKHWEMLLLDSLNKEENFIISKTTHFTDMINGVLKVPESPETSAYTPTSIKDIKAANPAAAVNVMEPPSASSMGNANLVYPINIPRGRKDMQPELVVSYSNGGGNGWMGMGWNMALPAITIDTRWGSPRFDPTKETETYQLNGDQLSPIAHGATLEDRSSEKRFYRRVEGPFERIIRHGDSPADYWWEITDKSGTRYFYGGLPSEGVLETSVLRDDLGNVAYWALREVRDLNGNLVQYNCLQVNDVGVSGGTVVGRQLYIEEIIYTGYNSQPGNYKVLFTRDREIGEAQRIDKIIQGNLGFKQVTGDLLRKIEVQLNDENIRSYEFKYEEGAFFKTLLSSIEEFDAAGNLFTTHEFDYYDDVRADGTTYEPFKNAEAWNPRDDNLNGGFLNPLNDFGDEVSALSGSKSSNIGFGLAITFGFNDGQLFCKSNTAGGDFGGGTSSSEGILAMVDINGDALPDKVLLNGNGFNYRANESGPDGENVFSSELKPISGINKFYEERSSSNNQGVQASGGFCSGFSAFVGASRSSSDSQTTVYFTDANGDQLIDIAVNGQVFFNRLDVEGNPSYIPSSEGTPNPINLIGSIDDGIVEIDPDEIEAAIDQNPLHDAVRAWTAPYTGTIDINAPVALVQPTIPAINADGVRVAIQLGGVELWNTTIDEDDFSVQTPSGVTGLTVNKGDRVYFRVQSIFNGLNDQVNWDPVITYLQHSDDLRDANDKPFFRYQASEDFLLAMDQSSATSPIDGAIRIEGTFVKPVTSDDVLATITKETDGSIIWQRNYTWDQIINEPFAIDLPVLQGDEFSFSVQSSTNIDWTSIGWDPFIFYTDSDDPDFPDENLTDLNGNPTISLLPSVSFSLFTQNVKQSFEYVSPTTDILNVESLLDFTGAPSGNLTFSIKKLNELLFKESIQVINGIPIDTPVFNYSATAGDELFFEYHGSDPELVKAITIARVLITPQTTGIEDPSEASTYTINEENIFGNEYRQWGQFAYNGNRERANQSINEADLKLDEQLLNEDPVTIDDLEGAETVEELVSTYETEGGYNPVSALFFVMVPDMPNQRWLGNDQFTFVTASTISSSRLGQDDLNIINPIPEGGGARAISKSTRSTSESLTAGGGFGAGGFGINGSFSNTTGSTRVLSDFMDMNGDRYPDIVGESKIQYTRADGSLEPSARSNGQGLVNVSDNTSNGVTLGGTYATPNSQGTTIDIKERSIVVGQGAGGGLNGNFAEGANKVGFSWDDMNGDGLPDRIDDNGNVSLNVGYRFLSPEPWGYAAVQESESESFGAGLGVNIGNNSIAGGVSLSRSESTGKKMLQDMNGDGLTDEVVLGNPIRVRINTGNGFGPPIPWSGADAFSNNSTTSESANAAFTVCFSPFLIPVKFCTNPSSSFGRSTSRELIQIQDINGDGYPDFLTSENDDELTVKQSTIDRTNMLKEVKRPLGSVVTMDYERTGNTFDQPNTIWTLASCEIFDGVPGDGADRSLSTYEYENGFFNRNEREFFGFRVVRTNHHDTEDDDKIYRTITQTYRNDNYFEKGLLISDLLADAEGNPFNETINTYDLKDVITGQPLPEEIKESKEASAFPAMVEMVNNFYEGQPSVGKSMRMTYVYDAEGNIIRYTDFGDEGQGDDIFSQMTYHRDEAAYLINIPESITVSGSDVQYRYRESDIDGAGNVTQLRKFLEDGTQAIYDMSYDQFGNLIEVVRPLNHKNERLAYTYEYDPEVQTYVEKITDSYGYSSTSKYDYRFGQLLQNVDLNGSEMRYVLDDLGRTVSITGPLEIQAGIESTITFDYHPEADIPWALTQHYDPQNPENPLETVQFIDGLRRVIQTKKDGAIYQGEGAEDEEVMLVSGRVTFDAFERTVENYYPLTEAKGTESVFNERFDDVQASTASHDVLDREVELTLPDGSSTRTIYDFAADREGRNQFSTLMIDANGIEKESFINVRQLLVATREQYSQGTDVWTSNEYNAMNELVNAEDDEGNMILSTYDWFGRRERVTHPDAGTTIFSYDPAGNVTRKQTANLGILSQFISYEYDRERLLSISYPQNPQNDVTYTYGEDGADFNRAGRVVLQEDATGTQEFFYNPLGALVKNVRTIVIPGKKPRVYTTDWEYDTWNRVLSITYPSEETLTYAYNLGGKLRSFAGTLEGQEYFYVKQLGYDKFEQRVYMGYGNEAETFYTYEEDRRRLKTLKAETAKGREMMDNRYQYDQVTNILKIENKARIPDCKEKIGGPTEYNFAYDDLYRLTSADGIHYGRTKDQRYTLEMNYSDIHNITKKDQLHEVRHKRDDDDDDGCGDDDDDGDGGGDDDDGGGGDDDDDGDSSANTTFDSYDDDDDDGGPEWKVKKRTTYDWEYEYSQSQPHAAIKVGELIQRFDANGNLTRRIYPKEDDDDDDGGESDRTLEDDDDDDRRITKYFWDEENRLMAVKEGEGDDDDDNELQFYLYDADNIRVLKSEADDIEISINGSFVYSDADLDDFTTYVNPYFVIRDETVTSHYYIEGERVATKIIDDDDDDDDDGGESAVNPLLDQGQSGVNYDKKEQELQESLLRLFGKSAGETETESVELAEREGDDDDDDDGGVAVYYYHKDHLGSTGYTTDLRGEATQHLEYFAFGESFVEERNNAKNNPYRFNAKELDEETGFYYYGARYYDPRISQWISVDPLAEKYPGVSPYAYTLNNPIVYRDPDGRDAVLIVFPDYMVDTETRLGKMPLGHAGVLLIDNRTGLTKYYEYGRYATTDGTRGRVRSSDTDQGLILSNVVIDPKTGKPTEESLNKVLGQISRKSGQGGRIQGAYIEGDFEVMNDYAQSKLKESNPQYSEYDKDRDPYSLSSNNCGTFGCDVVKQDEDVEDKAPWIIIPTPDNIAEEYQDNFPKVDYDPKTNTTTSEIYKKEKE